MGKAIFDFNKQILFAEIGAFAGAPLFATFASYLTNSNDFIAYLSVIGAIVGSVILWIATRVYDKRRAGAYALNSLAKDIMYFTPAAFILAMSIYYPSIFYLSRYLFSETGMILSSVIVSQSIAFIAFLTAMNIYRYGLILLVGKHL